MSASAVPTTRLALALIGLFAATTCGASQASGSTTTAVQAQLAVRLQLVDACTVQHGADPSSLLVRCAGGVTAPKVILHQARAPEQAPAALADASSLVEVVF